jgi:hypothetical protein
MPVTGARAIAKKQRQARYKTAGAAADLVRVEVLVPPSGRESILKSAETLRRDHRAAENVRRVIEHARHFTPKKFTPPRDIDRIIETFVNVPFRQIVSAATLAQGVAENKIPPDAAAHFERFLGEASLDSIIRFNRRHGIAPSAALSFLKTHAARLSVKRPDIESHYAELLPRS